MTLEVKKPPDIKKTSDIPREKSLGEDEKQELLREYATTQERISKARQKLDSIRKMLETPGISAETKSLYEEAGKLLDGIVLPALTDIQEIDSVEKKFITEKS